METMTNYTDILPVYRRQGYGDGYMPIARHNI